MSDHHLHNDPLIDSIEFYDDFERDYAVALDCFSNRIMWAVSDRRINPAAYQKRLELQKTLAQAGSFLCLGLDESLGGEHHGDGELSEDDFRLKYYLASKQNYLRKIDLLIDSLDGFHKVAKKAHPLDKMLPFVIEAPGNLPDAGYDQLNWCKMRKEAGLSDEGAKASIIIASQTDELGFNIRSLGWGELVPNLRL